ncbi:MAG: bifunctional 5,10-methylenetetrahydrofolate dehydrogenase/5,10-methenyltetrahydrofolate cyclohydrolase [Coriobacteriales bacterium]
MSATILEGPKVAEAISESVLADAEALKEQGVTPCLAILRVGERGDDLSYERGAMKRAEVCGMAVKNLVFADDVTTDELVAAVEAVNADDAIHGLLILRPLPAHIDEERVCNTLVTHKDVDACTERSLGAIFTGSGVGFAPCTAQACIEILDHYGIEVAGKRAVVIGRSLVIGRPLAMLLLERNATVTIAHSRTVELEQLAQTADIVVACVGRAAMIGKPHVSAGQTLIDVGINVTEEGALVGDVAFDEVVDVVDAVTPVPRGVGSVTTSVLCKHVVQAAQAMLW